MEILFWLVGFAFTMEFVAVKGSWPTIQLFFIWPHVLGSVLGDMYYQPFYLEKDRLEALAKEPHD